MFFSDDKDFNDQRREMVNRLESMGSISDERIKQAFLSVKRENFMDSKYKSSSYHPHNPYPIPGKQATISAPDTYALFYESLELEEGDNFLEIGSGSGYGAALAKEIVGSTGKVTTIEMDDNTFKFAKENLREYDVDLINKDGRRGYKENAPYDKIAVTAATERIPDPLKNQLKENGKIIAPIGPSQWSQVLTLYEKRDNDLKSESLTGVRYVKLRKS